MVGITSARLRALATRCRELAETATDAEAASALRDTACELETISQIVADAPQASSEDGTDPQAQY
jgi:hypothetical protein